MEYRLILFKYHSYPSGYLLQTIINKRLHNAKVNIMAKTVLVHIESVSPYSSSRMHDTPKLDKESHGDYEIRTWREKSNYDSDGMIFIPAMAFKQALDDAAKMFSTVIPGKGKSTYTKHFKSGVLCLTDMALGFHKDKVDSVTINANADGVRGSGKRVKRTFPIVPKWKGVIEIVIGDDTITPDVFEKFMKDTGRFIGVGRFRPQNGGTNGRFNVVKFEWTDI